MLSQITMPLRMALRAQEISVTFSRYGVGGALTSLGFEVGKRGLKWVGGTNQKTTAFDAVFGKNLARTFVKLGPTFIKMGQFLATRPDITGDAVANELKVLFDRVDPISFFRVKRILAKELGRRKLDKLLGEIDPNPLASASLGQTHRARLKDGTPIILKIQKPKVASQVRVDLALIESFVWPLHLINPKLNLLELFRDFKNATLREIDYREEAKNIDQFQKNYRRVLQSSEIVFPRYFPELLSEKVIALEPMHGKKLGELKKGSLAARKAAEMSLSALLEQVFDHGFFHADPHAGNLFFIEDQGRLAFIDLGLVGQLDPEDKKKFLKVFFSVIQKDKKKLARSLYDLGVPSKHTKMPEFEKDISDLVISLKKKKIDDLPLEATLNELINVAKKNGLHVPQRYILMMRSCLMIEGVARSLDPKLSVARLASPVLAKGLIKSLNPFKFFRKSL